MWKVLLSEGEPAGARSPELYEPLGTGTCGLAQVFVGRGMLASVFLPLGGAPGRLRWDSKRTSCRVLGCRQVGSLVLQVGTQVPRVGQPRRHFGFACQAPGLWRRGTLVVVVVRGCLQGKATWRLPSPHWRAHVVGPATSCPCLSIGLLPGWGLQAKLLGPCPQPTRPEKGLVWWVCNSQGQGRQVTCCPLPP